MTKRRSRTLLFCEKNFITNYELHINKKLLRTERRMYGAATQESNYLDVTVKYFTAVLPSMSEAVTLT